MIHCSEETKKKDILLCDPLQYPFVDSLTHKVERAAQLCELKEKLYE